MSAWTYQHGTMKERAKMARDHFEVFDEITPEDVMRHFDVNRELAVKAIKDAGLKDQISVSGTGERE